MSEIPALSTLDKLLSRVTTVEAREDYLKILVYGPPGVGKTVFSATSPHPLIVDIEKGAHSINNHPDIRGTAKVLPFKSIKQLEILSDYLKDDVEQLHEYQTIVIDSFSELQKRDLDEIVAQFAAMDSSRNKYLPTGPDYNINTEHMRQIASNLRDLDRHIIVTCSVKEEKDDARGTINVRPNLTPKLSGTLAGIFDIVAYMNVRNDGEITVRTMQIHPSTGVVAKSRVGGLPSVIENPTFSEILTAFKEN